MNNTSKPTSLHEALDLKTGTFTANLSARVAMFLRAQAFDLGVTPDALAADLLTKALLLDGHRTR